jgi:hypothetical protein
MKKVFAAVSLLSLIAAPTLEAKNYFTQKVLKKKYNNIDKKLSELQKEAGAHPTPEQKREMENLYIKLLQIKQKLK